MKWQIEFYNEKIEKETLLFPKTILAKLLHIFELIEDLGPQLGEPYTKSLKNGLFEIRAKGKEGIGRSIYCYQKDNKIIILHSFIKKTNKTPKKELEIALKRKKEVDNETNI
jgi:phage-related protein